MFKHAAFRTALPCFRQKTLIVEENGVSQFYKV